MTEPAAKRAREETKAVPSLTIVNTCYATNCYDESQRGYVRIFRNDGESAKEVVRAYNTRVCAQFRLFCDKTPPVTTFKASDPPRTSCKELGMHEYGVCECVQVEWSELSDDMVLADYCNSYVDVKILDV